MPSLWPAGSTGQVFMVPNYNEPADVVAAFQEYSTQLTTMLPPIGTILPFLGKIAPPGWLLCNGSGPYKTSDFKTLAALLGATGDTFTTPNLTGRTIIGPDPNNPAMDNVLDTGGSSTVQLLEANMPAHKHTGAKHTHGISGDVNVSEAAANHGHTGTAKDGGSHNHDSRLNTPTNFARNSNGSGTVYAGSNTDNMTAMNGLHGHEITVANGDAKHTHTATNSLKVDEAAATDTGSTGGGQAFSIVQPYLVLNYIVRAQ